jgi:thymidylate synthase
MVSAWNVGELDQMVLPPCHYGFQMYTRELTWQERRDIAEKTMDKKEFVGYKNEDGIWVGFGHISPFMALAIHSWLDNHNIPKRAISLMFNQRSVDTFLGLPFNIASYGLLLMMIADEVNMVPDQLIGNLGDVHLYNNHIEQAKEQIGREYSLEERVSLWKKQQNLSDDATVSFNVEYASEAHSMLDDYNIPKRTREPFELPTVHVRDGIESFMDGDIILENYQSHPSIKAPLSN